jgi:phosphocarrier protein
MIKREVIIKNKSGIHARPASILVNKASRFSSDISLEKNGEKVDCKSILGVMMLAATCGSSIIVYADGEDEKEAAQEVAAILESDFEED